jgi:flagellar protein FlgJ
MDIAAASFDQARFAINNAPTPKAGTTLNDGQVKKAAEDFEAFFISQFVETMLSGIKTDGPFGGGNAEGIYRSMMAQEYGKSIAASGGLGIADSVQKTMIQMQENAQ